MFSHWRLAQEESARPPNPTHRDSLNDNSLLEDPLYTYTYMNIHLYTGDLQLDCKRKIPGFIDCLGTRLGKTNM